MARVRVQKNRGEDGCCGVYRVQGLLENVPERKTYLRMSISTEALNETVMGGQIKGKMRKTLPSRENFRRSTESKDLKP